MIIALLLLVLWGQSASAASQAPPPTSPSVPELEQLVETLQDDKGRTAFLVQLKTLIAAQRAAAVNSAEPEDLFSGLSRHINALAEEVLAGVAVMIDAPLLFAWAKGQIANAAARARWIEVAIALVIVFGAALMAEWLVRRLLARLLPRAPTLPRNRPAVRVLLVGTGIVVEVLPI